LEDEKRFHHTNIQLNVLDVKGRGEDRIFLTVLGASGEQGDSGQVGGGNM